MKLFSKKAIIWLMLAMLGMRLGYALYQTIDNISEPSSNCTQFQTTPYNFQELDSENLDSGLFQYTEWEAPKAQDTEGLWIYGVFQPPCFAYDACGTILQAYPVYTRSPRVFSCSLLQLEQLYYPLVFEGYYQSRGGDSGEDSEGDDYTFLVYDEHRKASFRLKLEEKSEGQIQVLAFQSTQWDPVKQCLQTACLELWDATFQESFSLALQQKLRLNRFRIGVGLVGEEGITFSQVGDRVQAKQGVFCLRAVYPHCQTVLLEYQEANSPYPDYFYLSL